MTRDEKQSLATILAGGYVGQMGIVQAIAVQLSAWDLLWFGLAILTAFGMVAGRKDGHVQA